MALLASMALLACTVRGLAASRVEGYASEPAEATESSQISATRGTAQIPCAAADAGITDTLLRSSSAEASCVR
jgi:hypothetical protein